MFDTVIPVESRFLRWGRRTFLLTTPLVFVPFLLRPRESIIYVSDDPFAISHYYHHDAYLPFPGAPSPPPLTMQEFTQQQDRAFYDTLGDERPGTPCGEPGCDRGAILFSTRCRRHHFENVKGRPCVYE